MLHKITTMIALWSMTSVLASCGITAGSKSADSSSDSSAGPDANSTSKVAATSATTTGGTSESHKADLTLPASYSSVPSSFYISGQSVTLVTEALTKLYGTKCSRSDIGNFKALKSSDSYAFAVCMPLRTDTIGSFLLTSNDMLSLDNPMWVNPNIFSKSTYVGFYMTKDPDAQGWEFLIFSGQSSSSTKNVEATYISVPRRNVLVGSVSNRGFYAYSTSSAAWATAPQSKVWPTAGDNSIAKSANFGSISHVFTNGELPKLEVTVGTTIRELKSIQLP